LCQADSVAVSTDMPTAAKGSIASDTQRNSSLSALKLSEIAVEPTVARQSVTATSSEDIDGQSAATESEIGRLSRDSNSSVSTATDTQPHSVTVDSVPSVVTETVSASGKETGSRDSRPGSEIRARPIGTIFQSSLPEDISATSGVDDDLSATVSLFLIFIISS